MICLSVSEATGSLRFNKCSINVHVLFLFFVSRGTIAIARLQGQIYRKYDKTEERQSLDQSSFTTSGQETDQLCSVMLEDRQEHMTFPLVC